MTTEEPPQNGPKTVILEMPGPPVTAVGYKRPSQYDKDDIPLDLIQILLSQGRTGMLYSELVQEKRLAQQAQAIATNPDGRFPNLFVFLLVPAPGAYRGGESAGAGRTAAALQVRPHRPAGAGSGPRRRDAPTSSAG